MDDNDLKQTSLPDRILTDTNTADKFLIDTKEAEQRSLFSNPIDTDRAFGITRKFSDKLNQLTDEITPQTARENYK